VCRERGQPGTRATRAGAVAGKDGRSLPPMSHPGGKSMGLRAEAQDYQSAGGAWGSDIERLQYRLRVWARGRMPRRAHSGRSKESEEGF